MWVTPAQCVRVGMSAYKGTKGNESYKSFPRANARTCSENGSDIDNLKPLTNWPKVTKSMKVFPRVDARTCS